jgi:hypothetical protein
MGEVLCFVGGTDEAIQVNFASFYLHVELLTGGFQTL